MITSLNRHELLTYICTQLDNFFPDKKKIDEHLDKCLDNALLRLEFCLDRIILHYQRIEIDGKQHTYFNHVHSDQYAMFLYILSNEVWNRYHDFDIASKIMYLNKILHSLNCMYEVQLPRIFYFYHTVGTVIGKSASFSDYFLICHGVTVGMQAGKGPRFGKRVSLLPKCSVVGDSYIGENSNVGINSTLYNFNVPDNHTVYTDRSGVLNIKLTASCYADTVFAKNE